MSIQTRQFLTFLLGEEFYGVAVDAVREITQVLPITRVPNTPEFVRGVVNLRGRIIPVVDLRRRFELPPVEPTRLSCIIVVQLPGTGGSLLLGLIVDSVSEVLKAEPEEIAPPPAFGSKVDTSYLEGIVIFQERVILLLDMGRLLTRGAFTALRPDMQSFPGEAPREPLGQ